LHSRVLRIVPPPPAPHSLPPLSNAHCAACIMEPLRGANASCVCVHMAQGLPRASAACTRLGHRGTCGQDIFLLPSCHYITRRLFAHLRHLQTCRVRLRASKRICLLRAPRANAWAPPSCATALHGTYHADTLPPRLCTLFSRRHRGHSRSHTLRVHYSHHCDRTLRNGLLLTYYSAPFALGGTEPHLRASPLEISAPLRSAASTEPHHRRVAQRSRAQNISPAALPRHGDSFTAPARANTSTYLLCLLRRSSPGL